MNQELKNQSGSDWLRVRFQQTGKSHTDIPVQLLISGLAAASRLVYLLSGAFVAERYTPLKPTSDLRSQFEQQFRLAIGQSEAGSYTIPLRLDVVEQNNRSNLFPPITLNDESVLGLKKFVDQSLMLAAKGELENFQELFPLPSNAKRIAEAVMALMPAREFRTEIESKTSEDKLLVDSQHDREATKSMLDKISINDLRPKLHTEQLTVVAQLEAIDLVSQTYRARSNEGFVIQGNTESDLQDSKCRISPPQVEFDGVFQLDEHNNIQSMESILSSRLIDTSPIQVTELQVNNELLHANPPLNYKVGFLKSDSCYYLEGDLGLTLHAFSRGELESALTESLESWWLHYALEDDEKLSTGAQSLKRQLLSRFQTV